MRENDSNAIPYTDGEILTYLRNGNVKHPDPMLKKTRSK